MKDERLRSGHGREREGGDKVDLVPPVFPLNIIHRLRGGH